MQSKSNLKLIVYFDIDVFTLSHTLNPWLPPLKHNFSQTTITELTNSIHLSNMNCVEARRENIEEMLFSVSKLVRFMEQKKSF